LRQIAVIGLLKAAARFDGSGGRSFRPYARTYANGEITHYLRDNGFAIKLPPSWRDTFASWRCRWKLEGLLLARPWLSRKTA